MATGVSGNFPTLQERINEFEFSGAAAISTMRLANDQLEGAKKSIYLPSITALTSITVTNLASQSLLQEIIVAASRPARRHL